MKQNQTFWGKVAEKYAKKSVPSEERYEKKLEITRSYLKPKSKVLEFACGTGTTALKHAKDAASITAYDLSPEMIRIANEKKAMAGNAQNVTFEVAAVEDIDFGTNQFDAVLAHSILHLTFNNEATLRKVLRGLRKGGVIISSSGCIKDMNFLITALIAVMRFFGKAPEINAFTSDELVALHEKVGFKIAKRWDYKKGELYLVAQKP